MVCLWIALAAVLAAALLLLGAAVFFFKFSIRRYRKERADEQYEEADSIWNPFAPPMKGAEAYIRTHTRGKVNSIQQLCVGGVYVYDPFIGALFKLLAAVLILVGAAEYGNYFPFGRKGNGA